MRYKDILKELTKDLKELSKSIAKLDEIVGGK